MAVISLGATACGSDSNDVPSLAATPTPVVEDELLDREAAMLEFSECMRGEGIEIADPVIDTDGNIQYPEFIEGFQVSKEEFTVAFAVCEEIIEGFTFEEKKEDLSEIVDQYVELAACLRDQGFEVDDPTAETIDLWLTDFKTTFDWDDPDDVEAFETCSGVDSDVEDENVLADSGLPQPIKNISLDAKRSGEDAEKSGENTITYSRTISIGRAADSPFSNWLFSFQEGDLTDTEESDEQNSGRSAQVVTEAYFDEDGELLGYVELSNGPAYGRDILRSVTWGWAVAALTAVLIAAAVGIWISRRFSTPLESLTHTTSRMTAGNLSARSDIDRQDEFGILATSFNKMAESIETKVATLRRFVADAAHELGTPLTALRTNLELIDDEHVPSVLEQVERMDALTHSLLDLSQLEALEVESHHEDVDLATLLQNSSEPCASRAEQAGLTFSLSITGDPVKVKGNPSQLETLVQNLLDNAVKFTPEGGQVDVNLSTQEDAMLLTVEDTGIGIPEDDIPHLFSRFHRGRNASPYPGSGLGSAIVKAIADQHRASIDVKHKPSGTIFILRFSPS